MTAASLTWLGHASFRLDSPGGKRIYVDPWFDNPKCPANEKEPDRCDVIAVTHGHSDHLGSVVAITEKLSSVPIVAQVELKGWLRAQGAQTDELPGPNKGGTVAVEGVKFTLRTPSIRAPPTTGRIWAKPPASSLSSRTGRRSTSQATRASSATCS